MLEKSIRTDVKKLINQRRALFQNNTIKMEKIKKEISKDYLTINNPNEKPSTIRNIKGAFFKSPERTNNDFPPKRISSIKFQQDLISEIENVNLFGSYSNNKTFVKTSVSKAKKPFKLNPLKLSKVQKKVLKIDDFILLESELPNIFLNNNANKFNISSEQIKEFNKKLIQELRKLNVFAEDSAKVEVASINKKLINKKAYKTYDKVLGDKFKIDFLNNKINSKQNYLRDKLKQNNSNGYKRKVESFNFETINSVSAESEQNNDFNFNENLIRNELDKNNKNKKTYLTAFDALDDFHNLDYSDSEGIGNPLSKNIQSKLDKFSKHIQTENTQSNSSIDLIKDKNKCLFVKNINSRGSSNNSRHKIRANSNSVYSTVNNSNMADFDNGKSVGNKKSKSDKSFLDNYIRLPNIVVSRINLNNTDNYNGNSSNKNNYYSQNDLILESKQLLRGFNKTKKARYNLDSLVSKISYKIGNGFPLQKYINNYEDFSSVYPKKNLTK